MKKLISLARVHTHTHTHTHTSNLIEIKISFEEALILMHARDG